MFFIFFKFKFAVDFYKCRDMDKRHWCPNGELVFTYNFTSKSSFIKVKFDVKVKLIAAAAIVAVRPLFEEWLKRRHGVLTFRLMGPHRTWSFREVRAPNRVGRNVRVSPLCRPPGGHGRTYGGGVPRLGSASPCPP